MKCLFIALACFFNWVAYLFSWQFFFLETSVEILINGITVNLGSTLEINAYLIQLEFVMEITHYCVKTITCNFCKFVIYHLPWLLFLALQNIFMFMK